MESQKLPRQRNARRILAHFGGGFATGHRRAKQAKNRNQEQSAFHVRSPFCPREGSANRLFAFLTNYRGSMMLEELLVSTEPEALQPAIAAPNRPRTANRNNARFM
jgi:hypothetical protein